MVRDCFNVKEGSFQTRSITTQQIAAYELEKPENEITENQAEQSKGKYTFGFGVIAIFSEKYRPQGI